MILRVSYKLCAICGHVSSSRGWRRGGAEKSGKEGGERRREEEEARGRRDKKYSENVFCRFVRFG